MSISANIATMSPLLQAEAKRLAEAQKRHDSMVAIIESLPEGSPAPISVENFGYCADASLVFETEQDSTLSRQLLEMYPPLAVVSLMGRSSQKPKKYLRGDERTTAHWEIYPVLAKQSPSAVSTRRNELQWWTHVAGRDIVVTVQNGTKAMLQLSADRYALRKDSRSHTAVEYYVPCLKEGLGAPDALAVWQNRNGEFMDQQGYSAHQRMFGNALLGRVVRALPAFSLNELPEPVYMRGGDAIAIPEGVDMSERLAQITARQAARKPHPFDRIGDFWRAFTREQAEALVAFGLKQAQCYAEAVTKSGEQKESVKAWLLNFFAARPCVQMSQGLDVLAARVQQRCSVETGLAVKLDIYAADTSVRVLIKLQSGTEDALSISGTRNTSGPILLPQDIEVEYK